MFKLTSHAVERFCSRVEQSLSYGQALPRLEELTHTFLNPKVKG